jgi:hypothetical protein
MKLTTALPHSDVRIVNVSTDGHTFLKDKNTRFDSKEAWNDKFEKKTFPFLNRYCKPVIAYALEPLSLFDWRSLF